MPQDSGLAVITGTTHGIGRVTAAELARSGYTLVMLCRDLDSGRAVQRSIVNDRPSAIVHVVRCDLASFDSVRECARQVRQNFGTIDLFINNAGAASVRHKVSPDGYELTFATNHLGPFLLTCLLADRVAANGRIINVASIAHYRGILDLEHVADAKAPYNARAAYARSKLANVLHTFALARRLAGTQTTANCCHPGIVATNILPLWLRPVQRLLHRVTFDAARGARTTLYLAASNDVRHVSGRYFDENQCVQPASNLANDVALQESLWTTSARWTGLEAAGSIDASRPG
jgi:retinol dehydrogenase-12